MPNYKNKIFNKLITIKKKKKKDVHYITHKYIISNSLLIYLGFCSLFQDMAWCLDVEIERLTSYIREKWVAEWCQVSKASSSRRTLQKICGIGNSYALENFCFYILVVVVVVILVSSTATYIWKISSLWILYLILKNVNLCNMPCRLFPKRRL